MDTEKPSWAELASSQDYERDAPGAAYRAQQIQEAMDAVKLNRDLQRLRAENERLREALRNLHGAVYWADASDEMAAAQAALAAAGRE